MDGHGRTVAIALLVGLLCLAHPSLQKNFYLIEQDGGILSADMYAATLSTENPKIQRMKFIANVPESFETGSTYVTTSDTSTGNLYLAGGPNLITNVWQLFVVNSNLQTKELFPGHWPVFVDIHSDNNGGLILLTVHFNNATKQSFLSASRVDPVQQTITSICNTTAENLLYFERGVTAYDSVAKTIYAYETNFGNPASVATWSLSNCQVSSKPMQGDQEIVSIAYSRALSSLYGLDINSTIWILDTTTAAFEQVAAPSPPQPNSAGQRLLIDDSSHTAYFLQYRISAKMIGIVDLQQKTYNTIAIQGLEYDAIALELAPDS